ncbi:MAG: hypothetical protein OXG34_17200 [bacterium]|nr:hypothetical protein [bacterium]MCY3888841.1 hypothetical protein [bacterium]MCY3963376.1 hypothetical protein [bacterium]
MSESAACSAPDRAGKPWWQRMVETSTETDNDMGTAPLSPGEKLESLLHLAAFLPSRYSEHLEFPPFSQRAEPGG